MRSTVTVSVPGGQWVEGVRQRDVELRPLTTRDEVLLSDPDGQAGFSTASRLTWVLTRCVVRSGPVAPVDASLVRELTVGDREALALHLRRLLVGERMACVLACPECGGLLDLDLSVDELLVPPYRDARPWYEATVDDGGVAYRVRFRLPTGRDQEEAGRSADDASGVAAGLILRRCVLEVARDGESVGPEVPDVVAARLPGLMAEFDPQAVLLLDMRCPSCDTAFVAPFSPSAHLIGELIERSMRRIDEVHTLAMSYHWSEAAILALPERRRHAYLERLDHAASAGGSR